MTQSSRFLRDPCLCCLFPNSPCSRRGGLPKRKQHSGHWLHGNSQITAPVTSDVKQETCANRLAMIRSSVRLRTPMTTETICHVASEMGQNVPRGLTPQSGQQERGRLRRPAHHLSSCNERSSHVEADPNSQERALLSAPAAFARSRPRPPPRFSCPEGSPSAPGSACHEPSFQSRPSDRHYTKIARAPKREVVVRP